jgi:choline dehydrogenase
VHDGWSAVSASRATQSRICSSVSTSAPGEISPGPEVDTDEQILEWVARDAETALHPSCTCRMGRADDDSVVDPLTMAVHGVEGVRDVDASAMRYVTNGNIYAPVMMLAEKAADLILGNTPLAPEHVDWYRHQP